MAAARIRRDDEVVVISGKDRGKTGKVLRVDPKNDRVYVEGLNLRKRHQKPTPQRPNVEAGVVSSEAPIHISNVMLLDPQTNKPTRTGITREGGVRRRVAKRSGQQID
jgi:large subunit ribosomal protein L24